MEINISGNNQLHNIQMGDGNIMYVSNLDWDELKSFINKESGNCGISENDAHDLMVCAENHDAQGLKKILTGDKKNFLMNVPGSSVSTGLFMALEKLCGIIP